MILKEEMEFVSSFVRDVGDIDVVLGGLVHDVYKINAQNRSYFLKIRKPSSSKVEGIKTEKNEIIFEYEALVFFSSNFPDLFPSPMGCDQKIGALLMTDALPFGTTLLQSLKSMDKVRLKSTVRTLGSALGSIHLYSQGKSEMIPFNTNNDFDHILRFRYGYLGIPALDDMIIRVSRDKSSLILGGLSSKNILVNDAGNIAFVDLETVCPGNNMFDFSFCISHILLHNTYGVDFARELFEVFLREYRRFVEIDCDSPDIKTLILGTYLYRIDNTNIPYDIDIDPATRSSVIRNIRDLLEQRYIKLDDIFRLL